MAKTKLSSGQMAGVAVICALVVVGGITILVSKSEINPLRSSASSGGGPSFTIVSPNGGEVLNAGQRSIIQWEQSKFNEPVEVVIGLYNNTNGFDYYRIASHYTYSESGINNYEWVVPSGIGGNYFVRIFALHFGTDAGDFSDSTFNIVNDGLPTNPPNISVISPNGGEVLHRGEEFDIMWSQTSEPTEPVYVTIELFGFNVPPQTLSYFEVQSHKGKNVYKWTVPDALSGNYSIKVTLDRRWPSPHTAADSSDQPFTVSLGGPR